MACAKIHSKQPILTKEVNPSLAERTMKLSFLVRLATNNEEWQTYLNQVSSAFEVRRKNLK